MKKFKVGDLVEVIVEGEYSISNKGSYGYIENIDGDEARVNFIHLTGNKDGYNVWTIDINHIKLKNQNNIEGIKQVLYNGPATIIFWEDNSKTIVKKSEEDDKQIKGNAKAEYERRLGFLTAYFQKHSGLSKTKANKYIEKITKIEE